MAWRELVRNRPTKVKKKTLGSLKGPEKPVKTCETAVTGMVLPQVAIFHTVPVHVTPVTKIPRVYLYPCYSLLVFFTRYNMRAV
jgi:hypothetical protein